MERATISRIESWDARPVPGGYAGLSALADDGFTGAVAAGGTHLFMLNGRVVGVFDGTLSAFEGAESTAYEAPDPALPLLFAMQERGGDVRGKYYTDDTPLSEVDDTLTEGGFTGYLELSENVLSGDYYVVYYGGRSLPAAFVGNEERVVTGREAFELADDEVGIYEVRAVDVEVSEIPEPSEEEVASVAGAPVADEPATDDEPGEDGAPDDELELDRATDDDTTVRAEPDGPVESGADDQTVPDAGGPAEAETEADVDDAPDDAAGEAPEEQVVGEEAGAEADSPEESTATAGAEADDDGALPIEDAEAPRETDAPEPDDGPGEAPSAAPTSDAAVEDAGGSERVETSGRAVGARAERSERPVAAEGGPAQSDPDERFREEERWREARTVPALDPDESGLPREEREEPGRTAVETDEQAVDPGEASDPELDALRERVSELESELESAERERRRQAERAAELGEERDELLEEREALERRIEELEARLEEQESRIEAQDRELAAGPADSSARAGGDDGSNALDPETVLDRTDLFVRYGSKGKATLQTAHDGRAGREAVAENLRLETHSRFDASGATVRGRPYDEYLEDTIEYRFVAWLVEELLYEIQETGSERGLRALYDVLPKIDRAEFDGTVTGVDEEGEERRESFDVVCRDRMGKPLVVANINDSLDPATGEMMGDLVEDATAAGEAHESLGAAFLVTASFFEPDALETASQATGGGFLSRDSKKSFVKLSRKGGYHLSLVEARGGEFHVAVPEF